MPNKIKLENPNYAVNLTLTNGLNSAGIGKSDENYVHTQTQVNQSSTWNVNHNLGKYCSVTVVDNNNDVIIGEIHYVDTNNVILTFNSTTPVWGWAYCN
jgi:hypothetical protein